MRFLVILILLHSAPLMADNTEFAAHFVHYDSNFENKSNNRTQTGLGIIVRQQSALHKNVTVNVAGYAAIPLHYTGLIKQDVFPINQQTGLRHFALIGEASLQYSPHPSLRIELGRQQHHSLLLASKTRALPSSFEGASIYWKPTSSLKIYAHRYHKHSQRADANFQNFAVKMYKKNAQNINAIYLVGAKYPLPLPHQHNLQLHAEYLHAPQYLHKAGITLCLNSDKNKNTHYQNTIGYFISKDAGELFTSANIKVLDTTKEKNQRLSHFGHGIYWKTQISHLTHQLSGGISHFFSPWIEDNFTNDHGKNPFPSKTIGPDLTNNNETVWFVGYRFSPQNALIKNWQFSIKSAWGRNIFNSVSANLGKATEQWFDINVHYKPSAQWRLQLRYRKYQSSIMGSVVGVDSNRDEMRISVQYNWRLL